MHPPTLDAVAGHGLGQDRDHADQPGPPDPHPVPQGRDHRGPHPGHPTRVASRGCEVGAHQAPAVQHDHGHQGPAHSRPAAPR